MTCYHPLAAWRSHVELTESGKGAIVFRPPAGPCEAIELPCGQCVGCRLDRSRQWALRCVHESSLHQENCFLTLTYDPDRLPPCGGLCRQDYVLFLKRLRSRFPLNRIRYFLCGEYGDEMSRPHYHVLLFGIDFVDKFPWVKSGEHQTYRSFELEGGPGIKALWPHGYSWIGEVTWQSAAYVARYVMKKANGDLAYDRYVRDVDPETGELYMIPPEFIQMSRRPGIGAGWYHRWKGELGKDFLTHEGSKLKIPSFYDRMREVEDAMEYAAVKRKRKEVALCRKVDSRRLRAMEKVTLSKVKRLKRSI